MPDDFSKYEDMRQQNESPGAIDKAAKEDGLEFIPRIRIQRMVFGFSLEEAKGVCIRTDTGKELDKFQGELFKDITEALDYLDKHPSTDE